MHLLLASGASQLPQRCVSSSLAFAPPLSLPLPLAPPRSFLFFLRLGRLAVTTAAIIWMRSLELARVVRRGGGGRGGGGGGEWAGLGLGLLGRASVGGGGGHFFGSVGSVGTLNPGSPEGCFVTICEGLLQCTC